MSPPWIRTSARLVLVTLAIATTTAARSLDDEGALLGRIAAEPGTHVPSGRADLCGTCQDPALSVFEIEFVGDELWELSTHGTLYRMRACGILETIAIQGFRGLASGLGYDTRRGLLVVADIDLDQVLLVDLAGNVVRTLQAPTGDMIGAAYDSKRDLYWFPDWRSDSLTSLDPETGDPGPRYVVPEGTRIAGASYAASLDAIVYNGRNQLLTFFASAANGELLSSMPMQFDGGNNGEGVGLAPDGGIWLHHFEERRVVCIGNIDGVTPVHSSTWGRIKMRYR